MTEYAAFARIDGGRVRLLACPGPPDHAEEWGGVEDLVAGRGAGRSSSLGDLVRERSRDIREQWAITTFYLFDPNAWR